MLKRGKKLSNCYSTSDNLIPAMVFVGVVFFSILAFAIYENLK